MCGSQTAGDYGCMSTLKRLHWPLALGLGAFGLIRPVLNITGVAEDLGKPLTPVLVTIGISLVWIAIVGLSRVAEPVVTLLIAGIVYGVLAIIVSAILSPILLGELHGPLANPSSIVPVLLVNAVWGLIAGLLAPGVRRLRHLSTS